MKVISLVNQKGGCGKTTTAVNLAHAISRKAWRVLLIDLDPQAHATFCLGVKAQRSITDLLESLINKELVNLSDSLTLRDDNFFVLASSMGLSAMESMLVEQTDKLEILTKLLALAQKNESFDYCIIDCPPNLGPLTLNAIVASSAAIVPVGICELSLKGVENLNNILNILVARRRIIPAIYYLITQLDKRLRFSDNFVTKCRERFGAGLLSTMIRTNVHLREAAACGKSIYEYKKDSRGALDYQQLAEEIERSIAPASPIQFSLKDDLFNEVFVVGEFNNWRKNKNYQLKKTDQQTWGIALPLQRGTYRYKFIVDDRWVHDSSNSLVENDDFGGRNSILFVR